MNKWGLPQKCQINLTFKVIIIHCINKLKNENHVLISIIRKKPFENVQYPFLKKRKTKKQETRNRKELPELDKELSRKTQDHT